MKRHGQGKKIRGHNIQLWPLIAIYVCGVWRPSKSPMPVIYQHIFVFSLVNSHNLFSLHLIFFDRTPHLNPFRRKLVIKQYHKIAFKGSSIPLKNVRKSPNFWHFTSINIKIIFGHDRSWIYRKRVSNMAWPSSGWSRKVSGDVQGRGKPGAKAEAGVRPWLNGQIVTSPGQGPGSEAAKRWYFCTSEQSEEVQKLPLFQDRNLSPYIRSIYPTLPKTSLLYVHLRNLF